MVEVDVIAPNENMSFEPSNEQINETLENINASVDFSANNIENGNSFVRRTRIPPELSDELYRARGGLKEIDDCIRSLTGRNPLEFTGFRGGRGGMRGGGVGGYGGSGGRLFQLARAEVSDPRIEGVKRKFTAVGPPDQLEEDERKRFRRMAAGGEPRGFQEDFFNLGQQQRSRVGFVPPPTIASAVMPAPKDVKSRQDAIAERQEHEKQDLKQRNRRMFQNVLLGTLQRFRVEENKFKQQEKRQAQIEQKLEEQKRQEELQIEEQKQQLLAQRRRKEREIRRVQRKIAITQMNKEWEAHMRRLQQFIQTQAKPPIFYMPAKHSIRTIELHNKSQRKIEELLAQHTLDVDRQLKEIEQQAFDDQQSERRHNDAGQPSLASGGGRRGVDDGKHSEEESDDEFEIESIGDDQQHVTVLTRTKQEQLFTLELKENGMKSPKKETSAAVDDNDVSVVVVAKSSVVTTEVVKIESNDGARQATDELSGITDVTNASEIAAEAPPEGDRDLHDLSKPELNFDDN